MSAVLGTTLSYAASHSASPRLAAFELASYALRLSTPLLAAASPRVLEALAWDHTGEASVPVSRGHLVEFISPHCTVCAKTAPLVAELERACTDGDGTVVRVDVETPNGQMLAQHFGVHAVPTFL
jgi:thiol-disulfide isomerase/thioredoxin